MKLDRPAEILGCDLRSLGLFRIGLGLMLLYDLLFRLRDLSTFYSDEGVLPRSALFEFSWHKYFWSLHVLSGETWFQGLLFGVAMLAAIGLVLGWKWRFWAVLSWLMYLSLQNRNPGVLDGSDDLLLLMLFWGLFLPLGKRFSIDALTNSNIDFLPKSVFNLASVAILAQWFMVYFFAGIMKSGVEWHEEGTAMQLALDLDIYLEPFGKVLASAPPGLLRFMTRSVWYFEVIVPFLIFMPWKNRYWRLGVALAYIGLHLGIESVFFLGNYPKVGMITVLPLVPGMVWEGLGKKSWVISILGKIESFFRRLIAKLKPTVFFKEKDRSSVSMSKWIQVFPAFLIVVVLLWNISELPGPPIKHSFLKPVVYSLRIDQCWTMFAPYPDRDDGWFICQAKLVDGREIDVYPYALNGKEFQVVSYRKPDLITANWPNGRWQGYMSELWLKSEKELRPYFLDWIRRKWNASHLPEQAIQFIKMYYMLEVSEVDKPEEIKKVNLYNYSTSDWE